MGVLSATRKQSALNRCEIADALAFAVVEIGFWVSGVGEAFEGGVDEVAEVEAVDVFVGGFSGGVVATGEDPGDVVDVEGVEVFEDVEGVLEGEGEIVSGVDDERTLWS